MAFVTAMMGALGAGALPYVVWNFSDVQEWPVGRAAAAGALLSVLLVQVAPAFLLATLEQQLDPLPSHNASEVNATAVALAANATDNATAAAEAEAAAVAESEAAAAAAAAAADVDALGGPIFELLRALLQAGGLLVCCAVVLTQTNAVTPGGMPAPRADSTPAGRNSPLAAFTSIRSVAAAKLLAIACGWALAELAFVRFSQLWSMAETLDLLLPGTWIPFIGAMAESNLNFVLALGMLAAVYLAIATPFRVGGGPRSKRQQPPPQTSKQQAAAAADWLGGTVAAGSGKKGAGKRRRGRGGGNKKAADAAGDDADPAPAAASAADNDSNDPAAPIAPEAIQAWAIAALLAALPAVWRITGLHSLTSAGVVLYAVRIAAGIAAPAALWARFVDIQPPTRRV